MPFPLRHCVLRPVVAAAIGGAVLVSDPALARAAERAPVPAADGSAGVSAALELTSATEWYTGGQFVVRNTGATTARWSLRFRATGRTFDSWAGWMSDVSRDGDVVTITAKPGQELAPGAVADLSFGITGDGSVVPTVTDCTLDGAQVTGCAADGGDPEPPAGDTEAPGAVPAVTGSALDAHTVELRWDAAADDHGVEAYVVTREDAEPVRVDGGARSARIGGLPDGATHRFRVAAVDAAGNTGPGTPVEVATPAEPAAPQELVVAASHSIVPVRARGDAEAARAAEGRWFRHSPYEPTGRFVTAGDEVTVTVPEGVSGLVARFGMIGVYAGLNGGKDVGTTEVGLRPGRQTITVPKTGSLQIRDSAPEDARTTTVRVDGGRAMATAVEGETTEEEWVERMAAFDAPIVELVGSNVLVQVQKPVAQRWLVDNDIAVNPRIRMMERVITETDRVYGLDRQGTGLAHRADQRILVVNPDSGTGLANASHDRVMFHNQQGAMQQLLTGRPTDKWAFWHEVGHTYQPDWMRWNGLTEVTANVPALANQEREGAPNRLDTAEVRRKAAAYFALPEDERSFDRQDDVWLRLLMFDQLRRAFGEDVYARAAQQVRVDRQLGAPVVPTSDVAAAEQVFARTMATVTGRDLSGFFAKWGVRLTDETRAAMTDLPEPSFDLTANHDRTTDVVDHAVSYTLPTGSVRAEGSAVLHQRGVGGALQVTADHPAGVRIGRRSVLADAVGAGAGRVVVEFLAADGTPGARSVAVDVRRGTMAQFQGASDRVIAELALDPGTRTLRVDRTGGPEKAHWLFDSRYFGARVVAEDGRTVRDAWLKGTETAGAFWNRFGEVPVEDGQFLVLDHREPRNRLLAWSDDVRVPASTAEHQAFRIDGSSLVPVALSEVPGH
ncbi:M60 family metallopeptidase [Curtobacterium caseinilyticum]|uniref:M60 family metallopeptidase n=1 Tax=Curtobacterium caseinilyticum TaxID=3055137 RepID=A0ABT7TS41_9MICO|nr:M60 family metallopeptidase [Curtobacterium caseinilyticum]MDM7892423.1 M60 family metallopeptidase [Curtobacterium caseinilyticum]